MRAPVNPFPSGGRQRIGSVAVSFKVDVYQMQPGSSGAGGTTPLGQLDVVSGSFTDDASQNVARKMQLSAGRMPSWLAAGMWVVGTIGIQNVQPIIYRLPSLAITDVGESPRGITVDASDPGAILNGIPYEADTIITGTLRDLVTSACSVLQRPPDVSGVPALAVPAGRLAEFGKGRWDTCLDVGDSLGVALRFTDPGDVVGTIRANPAPSPAAIVERAKTLVDSGTRHHVRVPTGARVFVGRGSATAGLVGSATSQSITGSAPPPWYLPYIITDRHDGDPSTTQAQADQLATDFLRSRLSELDALQDMPILPAPWLESGVDVVTYYGVNYWLRALTLSLPSLATSVTLRSVV